MAAAVADKKEKKKASNNSSESEDEDEDEDAGESFSAEQYYEHFVRLECIMNIICRRFIRLFLY